MPFLKLVFVFLATLCAVLVFTYVWVVAQSRGAKATSLYGVSVLAFHSPLYWLLVAGMLTVAWWFSRRWLF